MDNVYHSDLILIFYVDEDPAGFVGDDAFRLAVQENGGNHLFGDGIDDADVMTATVAGDDRLRERFKKNGVGMLSGRDLVQYPPRMYVEDGDAVIAAIAGISFAKRWVEGYTMDSAGVRYDTDRIAFLFIQDDDM